MKNIPDFDIELAQAVDYILGSALAKKALRKPPYDNYTNILNEIIRSIDRLADNCHMPEFTNHAMPHICSIVKRASEWAESDGWLEKISEKEAAYLLMALLVHDIGMLSQDANDIPDEEKVRCMKGFSDIPNWVRRTHVTRLDKLLRRLLDGYRVSDEGLDKHLSIIIIIASSHEKWPWDEKFVVNETLVKEAGISVERIKALNAVLAVCDLLDEDSNRCDTMTLIKHRHGSTLNMAHWIRHALTEQVVGVKGHEVEVRFRKIIPSDEQHEIIYRALRNHYRLVKLYNSVLNDIGAEIRKIEFNPNDGIPQKEDEVSEQLKDWENIPEFKHHLVEQLMCTFMKEALNNDNGDACLRERLDDIGLESLSLTGVKEFLEPTELVMPEEKIIYGKGTVLERIRYIKGIADDAYINGNIGQLCQVCVAAIDICNEIELKEIYWAIIYIGVYINGRDAYYQTSEKYSNQLDIRAVNIHKRGIIVGGSYQPLLDVMLKFLEPDVSDEKLVKYREHLMKGDYNDLKEDTATSLLLETLIGMFFIHGEGMLFQEIAEFFVHELKDKKPMLERNVIDAMKRLNLQYKIFDEINCISEEELDLSVNPAFARAWIYLYRAEWKKTKEQYESLVRIAERNADYFSSVQGYRNMVGTIWRLEDVGKCNNYYGNLTSGVYRYQRVCLEHGYPVFWQKREHEIEELLAEIKKNGEKVPAERMRLQRLIALRRIEALKYWNFGEYIESIRNEARMTYELGVYENKYHEYCGIKECLPEAIILSIQGISRTIVSKEEMKKVFFRMHQEYPEGIDIVANYIINNQCLLHWEFVSPWMEYLAIYLKEDQVERMVKWIVQYNDNSYRQSHHFDLKEFGYLKYMVDKMNPESWELIKTIVVNIFREERFYRLNENVGDMILRYAPKDFCITLLEMIYGWKEEGITSSTRYGIIVELSKWRKEDMLDEMRLFVKRCREKKDCEVYERLEELIEVDNLGELKSIDVVKIEQEVVNFLKGLSQEVLETYDSRTALEVRRKMYNQNWSLADETDVVRIINYIQDFMKNQTKPLRGYWFKEFCGLFYAIANGGNVNERKKIVEFIIEEYINNSQYEELENPHIHGGLFSSVQIHIDEYKAVSFNIAHLLIACLGEISPQYWETCMRFMMKQLRSDRLEQYMYATILFSYIYFVGDGLSKGIALSGLMLIRGQLEIDDKDFENRMKFVVRGMKWLEKSKMWFGENTFLQLEKDDSYYRTMFTDIILERKQEVVDAEVIRWREG